MENTDNKKPDQPVYQPEQKPKSNKGLTILLVILIVVFAAVIIVLVVKMKQNKNESAQVEQILDDQKKSLAKELNDLMGEYDGLKTNNDSMNKLITGQEDKIKRLLRQRASNAELISKYSKELGTLRDVLKSYITQVDSLNMRNQQLVQENVEVKTSLEQARADNIKLSQDKDALSSQVQKASVIATSNITITPLNKRSKPENKVSRTVKVKVCFTLRENAIAKAGTKDIYIRITRVDGAVIAYSDADIFDFQGQQIVYSAKRQIEYENKDIDVCIFWDNNNQLVIGEYTIDIFTDGNLIGTTKFNMKK
jgi:flagellar basal body-associated protein FliL